MRHPVYFNNFFFNLFVLQDVMMFNFEWGEILLGSLIMLMENFFEIIIMFDIFMTFLNRRKWYCNDDTRNKFVKFNCIWNTHPYKWWKLGPCLYLYTWNLSWRQKVQLFSFKVLFKFLSYLIFSSKNRQFILIRFMFSSILQIECQQFRRK